jgi:hypothetical protein
LYVVVFHRTLILHTLTLVIGRHGDIEDTLLSLMMARVAGGKKFDKMMVARVYFGNWLRDYCMLILYYAYDFDALLMHYKLSAD